MQPRNPSGNQIDPSKIPGKSINIFPGNVRKTEITLPINAERNASPFGDYKSTNFATASNATEVKSAGYGVSRGIFNTVGGRSDQDTTPRNNEGAKGTITPNIQEYVASEMKNSMAQFKIEVTQYMSDISKGLNERFLRNRDGIDNLKEQQKQQKRAIDDVQKNLVEITRTFQTELEAIKMALKQVPPGGSNNIELQGDQLEVNLKAYTDSKIKNLELQQKEHGNNLIKMRDDFNLNVNLTLNDIEKKITEDNENKLKAIAQQSLTEWQDKLNKTLDHVYTRLTAVEKTTAISSKPATNTKTEQGTSVDPSAYERLAAVLDAKIAETMQFVRDQAGILKRMIDTKVDETTFKSVMPVKEFEAKLASCRFDVDSLRNDNLIIKEDVKRSQESYDAKLSDLRTSLVTEFARIERSPTASPDFRLKLDAIEKNLIELINNQKLIDHDMELQKNEYYMHKAATGQFEFRIRKLEETVDKLNKDHDVSLVSTKWSDTTTTTTTTAYDYYNKPMTFGNLDQVIKTENKLTQLIIPDNKTGDEFHSPRGEFAGQEMILKALASPELSHMAGLKVNNYVDYATPSDKANSEILKSPLNSSIEQVPPYEKAKFDYETYKTKFEKELSIPTVGINLAYTSFRDPAIEPVKSELEKPKETISFDEFKQYKLPITSTSFPLTDSYELKKLDNNVIISNSLNSPDTKMAMFGAGEPHPDDDLKKLLDFDKKGNFNSEIQGSSKAGNDLGSSVVIDKNMTTSQDIFLTNLQNSNFDKKEGEYEEISIEYQMDSEGYLMDEQGNYILDDQGKKVMLSEDQLDQLRQNNLLEEDF